MTDQTNSIVIHDSITPAPVPAQSSIYSSIGALEQAQRIGNALCSSSMVPKAYQGQANMANVLVALELANRMNASPLMVMQNLYLVQGKPSWSSQYMIAMINGSGRFSALRYDLKGSGNTLTCHAYATEKATGEILDGPQVTWDMAVKEGWVGKSGSKWQTMPELMIRYRAAAFWARLYVPEMLMGILTKEENEDITTYEIKEEPVSKESQIATRIKEEAEDDPFG